MTVVEELERRQLDRWGPFIKELLKTSGPAAVIAILLVWFLMRTVSSSMMEIHNGVNDLNKRINEAQVKMDSFAARQQAIDVRKIEQNDRMLELMRSICFSVADAPSIRANCAR